MYFNLFNHKDLFRPIWRVIFCKNVFIFWYSYLIANFRFRIFIIFSTLKSIYMLDFISTGFILMLLWYVLLYSLTISSILSKDTFFDIEVIYFSILFFKVLINLSAIKDFLWSIVKFTTFVYPHFVWLAFRLI